MDRAHPAATAALATAASAGGVIAIVQAAGRRIGIAGAHVVQAIVVPPDMAGVPRRAGGLVGVVTHGEQMLPVVLLEDWLAAADDEAVDADTAPRVDTSAPDARIVVLCDGALVVGLLVEAVVGMRRCPAGAIVRLFHDDRPDELFAGAVRVDADAAPIPLLEPGRLAALAGVWSAAAGLSVANARDAATGARDEAPVARTSLGVFRIGDVLVGIAVDDIGELLRTPALRPAPLRHASTRGLCDWRGRLLPVVDIGVALGASPTDAARPWMCVVRHGGMVLGVLLHEIVELHGVDVGEALDTSSLVRRELPTARGIVQVIDTAALMACCPESCISLRGESGASQAAPATSPHTWLVFESAGSYATRIDGVQEIVPVPPALRPRLEAGLDVSLPWRGHAVPVRDLFAGHGLAAAAARLLVVVEAGARRIAVPIVGVKAMIAPRTATLARLRVRAELVDIISTAAGADRASYEVVDLEARASAEPDWRGAA